MRLKNGFEIASARWVYPRTYHFTITMKWGMKPFSQVIHQRSQIILRYEAVKDTNQRAASQ